jgi:hypothetical protein
VLRFAGSDASQSRTSFRFLSLPAGGTAPSRCHNRTTLCLRVQYIKDEAPSIEEIQLFMSLSASKMKGATAQSAFATTPTSSDPYSYQCGFGNRFASESIAGVLPRGQNCPQRVKYDLYSEQLNGSSFVSSRAALHNVWMYRIRPSVAHGELAKSDVNSEASLARAPKNNCILTF